MKNQKTSYGPTVARKKLSSGDLAGLIILGFVVVALGGLFFWKSEASKSHVSLDPNTYCPKSGPYATTVVVVDLTDEVSVLQEQRIRNLMKSLGDSNVDYGVSKYEMLEVYLLSEDDERSIPTPLVKVCNPGDGEGIDEFTGNPQLANKRFVQAFLTPLEESLRVIGTTKSSNTSPIIEALRGISVSSFTKEPKPGYSNNLIVISDMLQNSKQVSFYRGDQKKGLEELTQYAADLVYVESIDLKVLDRASSKNLQGKSLAVFWRNFFRASGSNMNSAERWSE